MTDKISVVIYTYNEENNIKECLAAAKLLASNILIVDSGSTDKTVNIVKKEKIPVFPFPYSFYVEPARQFGIEKAKTDWVFILDADERITPELAKEIQSVIGNSLISNYKIPRRNIFGGSKWLRYGGWWPDYQIRLINKKYFKSWPKEIHSPPKISGKIGYLKQPLLHFFHGDFESMVAKTALFENIESDLLFKANNSVQTSTFFRKFLGEVYRRLIKNFGFLDGPIGIIESIYQAFSKTITYLFLYEKNLKVALYDPYLDVLGGGEKHILSILQVLTEEGYEPFIFWDSHLTEEIKNKFSLDCFKSLKFLPNIFKNKLFPFSTLRTLGTLRTFDYFFYVTDGSYFFSTAKKNFVFCMVPDKGLYQMSFLNRLKTFNCHFITNSQFTSQWLTRWGIKNNYIYPYIDDVLINSSFEKKAKIILSVGRFYQHLHAKNQSIIINLYKKIKQKYPLFKNFKLILAGGLKKEDRDYFNHLQRLAGDDSSIIFKPNIGFNELYRLYKLSTFYWHFTGYGVDEKKHPQMVEHLGISPLEAMAAGCLTFCYNAGGPKEIITDGKNGFLFNDKKELITKMLLCIQNQELTKKIITNAKNFVKKNFSYEVFEDKVKKIFLL